MAVACPVISLCDVNRTFFVIKLISGNGENENVNWYAIQVRPRAEISTARILENKGYESFVPLYKSRRTWSDRKIDLELPLFPSYIFCRFDPRTRLPIMTTPNVMRIVGTGKMPLPIEAAEIEAVQRIVLYGYKAEPHLYLTVGTRVLIEKGPLAGIEGIIKDRRNRQLVLSIGMVQQSICVDLNDNSLFIVQLPSLHQPTFASEAPHLPAAGS
jgi:transcription antitermination factor NusG